MTFIDHKSYNLHNIMHYKAAPSPFLADRGIFYLFINLNIILDLGMNYYWGRVLAKI